MDSERLSKTFVELADTLVADFDVLDFLHRLTLAAPSCSTSPPPESCSPTRRGTCG